MIKYFKVKKMETEMKYQFYGILHKLTNEKKDILELVKRLYVVLKDVPVEELRKEFLVELALLVHNEAEKQRELENI